MHSYLPVKCWNDVLPYQDKGEMCEVSARTSVAVDVCPCREAVLLYAFPCNVAFLKLNTTDLSLRKMLQKIYRKRLFFFFLSVVGLHVVWFQRHFLWLPQAWSFLKTRELSLRRTRKSWSDTAEASSATAPWSLLKLGVISILPEERSI